MTYAEFELAVDKIADKKVRWKAAAHCAILQLQGNGKRNAGRPNRCMLAEKVRLMNF